MSINQKVRELLHTGNYSCVVEQRNEIRTFHQKGIRDLYELVNYNPVFLRGASIADKVVGKAAAALIVAGGLRSVYADIISLSALYLLEKSHITTEFGNLVPYIQNRSRTDWCPMEKRCYDVASVNDILDIIQQSIEPSTFIQLN